MRAGERLGRPFLAPVSGSKVLKCTIVRSCGCGVCVCDPLIPLAPPTSHNSFLCISDSGGFNEHDLVPFFIRLTSGRTICLIIHRATFESVGEMLAIYKTFCYFSQL